MDEQGDLFDPVAVQNAGKLWSAEHGGKDNRIPVWLDCDTGHDDAFAVLLCAQSPRLKLLGISTVHGNSSLENTTKNTLSVLEAIGRRDIPVYPGSAKPFSREAIYAPSIHGDSGLDGTTVLPEPRETPKYDPAGVTGAMYKALATYPGKAWIVATGALTNVGLLFAVYPHLAESIAGFSIMGGAIGGFFSHAPVGKLPERLQLSRDLHKKFPGGLPDDSDMSIPQVAKHFKELGILQGNEDPDDERVHLLLEQARKSFGNWSPYAEFNIICDPEAAASLFSNATLASKTTLIPLDLTHQVLATPAVLSLLRTTTHSSTVRLLFHEIITFFASTYATQFSMTAGPPLHDPLAVAAIFAPEMFDDADDERFNVHVVTSGDDSVFEKGRRKGRDFGQCGRIVVRLVEKGEGGVRIPRTVDTATFWQLLNLALSSAEENVERQGR